MFQQRPTVCFFPVFSFLPENTSLCVLQTTPAAVTLWRSLYLPENMKTQPAPGWQSHLTPTTISCSALAALQSYFPHCTSPWNATEISQLSLGWTARDEVELKTCPIYSFIPTSCRLTWTRQSRTFQVCAFCWNILINKVESRNWLL